MTHRTRPDVDIAQMRALWDAGVTQKAIGERFGLPQTSVSYFVNPIIRERVLAERKAPRPVGQRRHMTAKQVAEIRALYKDGHTQAEIARIYGITPGGVSYHTRACGVSEKETGK